MNPTLPTPDEAQHEHDAQRMADPLHDGVSCWCCCWDCDFPAAAILKGEGAACAATGTTREGDEA